jgi:hypothetical protein
MFDNDILHNVDHKIKFFNTFIKHKILGERGFKEHFYFRRILLQGISGAADVKSHPFPSFIYLLLLFRPINGSALSPCPESCHSLGQAAK